jgi:hypothetical protein
MKNNHIILQNENVTITPHRAYLDGKTYLIKDLLSVSIQRRINQNLVISFLLLTIGIAIWVLGLLFWYYSGSSLLQPFLLGLIFFGLGLWQRREIGKTARYSLQLIDTRGKSNPMNSLKVHELEEIAQALKAAMEKGQASNHEF